MTNIGKQSPFLDGIPVVANTAQRDTFFPSPDTNQRGYNLSTGFIERYTGSTWLQEIPIGSGSTGLIDITSPVYGADPSGVIDSTAAIQAALTAAGGAATGTTGASTVIPGSSGGVSDSGVMATAGGVVFIPRGKFKISSTLYIPANVVVMGTGRGSVLWHNGTGNGLAFTRNGATDGYAFGNHLRDFMVYGTNDGGGNQHGIYVQYAQFGILQNVVVENCGGHGVWVNDHTVGMQFWNLRCRDNAAAQLYLDGISGSSFLNCDSHVIVGGLFHCNTRGTHSIKMRRTTDTAFYHPLIEGNATSIGLRMEGSDMVQMFSAFSEGHQTHLSIVKDSITGHRARKIRLLGGDWEAGANDHIALSIAESDETIIDGVTWNMPPANVNQSVITIASTATDTVIRGRCETFGLIDAGKNTRFEDVVTDAKGAVGVPVASTNLVGYGSRLNSGGWTAGAGIASRTEGQTGPLPGVPATRVVSNAGGANNYVQYPTGSVSLGNIYALSFWARATAQTYLYAKLTVPGINDEIIQTISLGTSFRRYVVQGPIGTLTPGNIAVTLLLADSTTVDIAGVQVEAGSPTPYRHTTQNATFSTQIGDLTPLGRTLRRVAVLTDGATVTIDAAAGDYFTLSAGAGRTIAAPTNAVVGSSFTLDLLNNTGGAITTSFNAAFKLAGAWTDPATTKRRKLTVTYDGTNWVEDNRSAADI